MNKQISPITFFIIILVICSIGILIKYANTPMSEVPFWVYWLIGGK